MLFTKFLWWFVIVSFAGVLEIHAGKIISFYIGTSPYARSAVGDGIYLGTLDVDKGTFGPVSLVAKVPSPSFLALSPDGHFLYATLQRNEDGLAAFHIEANGSLQLINQVPFPVAGGADHISVDGSGRFVLAASWAGIAAVFRINANGGIEETAPCTSVFSGSGPAKYQEAAHPHSIYTDPSDRFAYVCDLGSDVVASFRFDNKTGVLVPSLPFGRTPPGSGPRHLAFRPGGDTLYVNGQMGLNVNVFNYDAESGALKHIQTIPTLPPDAIIPKDTDTSEIICHPTGRWLYVGNRRHDSITLFDIKENGRLEWRDNAAAGVKDPVSMAISATGRWMIVAGQNDTRLALLQIDQTTGKLSTPLHTLSIGPGPACVVFAPGQ